MTRPLVLYGASNATTLKVLEAVNRHSPKWHLLGFVDDTPGKAGKEFFGYPVLGPRDVIPTLDLEKTTFFNNVFGTMPHRRQVAEVLARFGCRLTSLLSPDVDLSLVQVGVDVVVEEHATLDAFVTLGDHSCVKMNASVGHETTTGEFVFIGPGATVLGRVRIGSGAYIGAGSSIRNDLVVGSDSTVGLGAVVVKDVPPGVTVVGNPARILRT
jgi:sugar O-acyltransferase (sialic acid O-acetyltransferase NeuD family)